MARIMLDRRRFMASATAAAAVGMIGGPGFADEGPPETMTIRLAYYSNICLAPTLIAGELLRAEGFKDIQYVRAPESFTVPELVARGEVHFASTFAGTLAHHLDNGLPITALAGIHAGCYELFAHEPIRTISDLRGRSVAIQELNSDGHFYLAIMAAHVGLDPQRDFTWVTGPDLNPLKLFAEEGRCFPRIPTGASGAESPQSRSGDHQHGPGQAMVTIPLLRPLWRQGFRPEPPHRHQTLFACPPQGSGLLRRGAEARRSTAGRQGNVSARLRSPDAY
jgi:hypothetical protein